MPVTLGIAVSLFVGRIFNRSLYDYAIRAKQLPVLGYHMPLNKSKTRIKTIIDNKMRHGYELEVLESVSTVARIHEVITQPYHSIPVVNLNGKVIGIIPKNFIIVLIEQHCWYEHKEVLSN